MDIRSLKYFLAVAQEENITRAAAAVCITQPALSRRLQQLEEELGVKLFERETQKLTDEGHLLLRRAQELVALEAKTKQELAASEGAVFGEIAIGCGETQNIGPLSQMLRAFHEKYPEVTFDIHTAIADEVKERIEEGLLDFGLLLEPVEIAKYHYVKMPIEESWQVLMRTDCPLAAKERIEAADLAGVPLMIAKRQSVRNELEHWFGRFYAELKILATCNLSYSNRSQMVANGLGVCLVHEFRCTDPNLCLRPLYPPLANRSLLVWKKNIIFSRAQAKFIEHIRESAPAGS